MINIQHSLIPEKFGRGGFIPESSHFSSTNELVTYIVYAKLIASAKAILLRKYNLVMNPYLQGIVHLNQMLLLL